MKQKMAKDRIRTIRVIELLASCLLCLVQGHSQVSQQLLLMAASSTSINDNVHCGLQDKAGNLWFGTTGSGLYRYNGHTFTNYTIKHGLNSNRVWSITKIKPETSCSEPTPGSAVTGKRPLAISLRIRQLPKALSGA